MTHEPEDLAGGRDITFISEAQGTREELIAALEQNVGGHRSTRRQRQAAEAVARLRGGAASVRYGYSEWVVVGESQPYVAQLETDLTPHERLVRVEAASETDAWKTAWAQAMHDERVTRLYRLVRDPDDPPE